MNIAIFDYGAGNIFSLKAALERNGARKVTIIYNMKNLDEFDGLILPGVGNFDPAIRSISQDKIALSDAVKNRKMPMLGICLGMEMLFDKSEEGSLEGLRLLDGDVIMLPRTKVKIPHMGWNNLLILDKSSRLLHGIDDKSWVYFVHSYRILPKNKKIIMATSEYGVHVPSIIEDGNLFGTQFHHEKSGSVGAIMIKNFLKVCSEYK
jgi:glutamine amidotransferase